MKPILEIQNISKKFKISHQGLPYLSFREKLTAIFKSHEKQEDFWALHDVSFKVEPGQAVGIIGKNGAGKSTLLKILSKITPPTSGKIVSRGRIASLLEVGTGFHQELSGRENIYMNGSILGMKKLEIDSKFDEIVEFSGTEKFLDTPLKHYSSGMQLRLAFAVAAHLEPEILIIDEVLAVGDAEFQRKCLNKMEAIVNQGRTLLLVSHNLETIAKMCQNGVLLEGGRVVLEDKIGNVLQRYQAAINVDSSKKIENRKDRRGSGEIKFIDTFLSNMNGEKIASVFSGQSCQFVFEFQRTREINIDNFQLDIGLTSEKDERLTWFSTSLMENELNVKDGNSSITLTIDDFPFMPGNYRLTLFCKCNNEIADWVTDAFQFQVEAGGFYKSGKLINKEWGSFLVKHNFILH